jgi:threonine dehydrogenase-like Zn-dependent dehydrogenase
VVSLPITMDLAGIHPIGYSNDYPGGYGEQMVLSDFLAIKVPNGLSPRHAALTEPMAVGHHAVEMSVVREGDAAIVLGCGPVGLAVVAALRLKGVEPIVAADFSPTRRALARRWRPRGRRPADRAGDRRVAPRGRAQARRHLRGGQGARHDHNTLRAHTRSQVVVVVCMQPDPTHAAIHRSCAAVRARVRPDGVQETLDRIADGRLDVERSSPARPHHRGPQAPRPRRPRTSRQDPVEPST